MPRTRPPVSLFILALAAGGAAAQQPVARPGPAQQAASRSMQVLHGVQTHSGGQEAALRRCRGYMDEAVSAEKLGAADMAQRNWERAARGCKADAVIACQVRVAATTEDCAAVTR